MRMGSRIYRWRLKSRPRDVETNFTISFLAKIRGGGGAKTTHQGRLPVLCTMDDAMAAHYLESLCERVVAQACVDYNNAKTEAELRDESALAADLAATWPSRCPRAAVVHLA